MNFWDSKIGISWTHSQPMLTQRAAGALLSINGGTAGLFLVWQLGLGDEANWEMLKFVESRKVSWIISVYLWICCFIRTTVLDRRNKENINERTESLVVRFCVSHFFSQAGKIACWTAIFVYFNASKRNPAQGQTPSRGKEVASKRTNSLCHSAFWRLASRLLGNEALSS